MLNFNCRERRASMQRREPFEVRPGIHADGHKPSVVTDRYQASHRGGRRPLVQPHGIHRATHSGAPKTEHVGVDRCRGHVGVSQRMLHRCGVVSRPQEVSRRHVEGCAAWPAWLTRAGRSGRTYRWRHAYVLISTTLSVHRRWRTWRTTLSRSTRGDKLGKDLAP
jgi:hypothetical protein